MVGQFTSDDQVYYRESDEYKREQIEKKFNLFLNKSNIPTFYHGINFEDYEGDKESESFKKIKYYADNCNQEKFNHVSMYLWGLHGCQKTALACNIGKEAMKKGLRVKFILAGELISKFMKLQGYGRDEDVYDEIEDLKTYDMVIIDDFGDPSKELQWKKNMDLITSEWDRFFRHMLSNGVKIVLTSNYSLDVTQQVFGISLFELLDRNFCQVMLIDSVKHIRKLNVLEAFADMNTNK